MGKVRSWLVAPCAENPEKTRAQRAQSAAWKGAERGRSGSVLMGGDSMRNENRPRAQREIRLSDGREFGVARLLSLQDAGEVMQLRIVGRELQAEFQDGPGSFGVAAGQA